MLMSFASFSMVVVSVSRNRGCMFLVKASLTWSSSVCVKCLSWVVTYFLLWSSVVLKPSWLSAA